MAPKKVTKAKTAKKKKSDRLRVDVREESQAANGRGRVYSARVLGRGGSLPLGTIVAPTKTAARQQARLLASRQLR